MKMKNIQKKSSLFIALALCSQAYGQDYYVDSNAATAGTGTESNPYKSLSAAIDAANKDKNGSDTILLRAGRYQTPIIMSDIGDVTNPITITAFNNEDVIIDGTKSFSELSGSHWTPLDGVGGSSPIVKTTISEDIWQLWVDDKMAVVARWPNVTVGHPTDPIHLKADHVTPKDGTWWDLNGTWGHMSEGWSETSGDATMKNDSAYHDLSTLGKSVDGGSVILNFHSETQFSRNITNHTSGSNSFDYERVKRPFDKGQGHFIIEHKNALDMPGEWYYDKNTKEVWLWPEVGQSIAELSNVVRGKVSTYAFDLVNAQHLTIKNLTFFGTTISCKECDSVTIEGNKFLYPSWHDRMLGNHRIIDDTKKKDSEGVNVTAYAAGRGDTIFYGSNYRIKDNEFAYSDAAIEMRRGSDNSSPENNQVENNLFHHFSFTGMAHSMLQMNANKGDSWQKRNTFHTNGSRAISKVAYVDVSMSRASHWGYLQQDGVAWQSAGGDGIGGGSDGTIRHHLWVHDAVKPAVRWDGFDGINGTDHHEVAINVPGFGMIKGDQHHVYNSVGVLSHDPNATMFKILNTNEKWKNAPGDDTEYPRNQNSLIKNNLSDSISGQRTGYLALTATDENNWNGYLKNTVAAKLLRDAINFDFRPKANATEIINQGQVIAGITDDVTDGLPDIGAYEYGASAYWIPGFQYLNKATSPVPRLGTLTAKTDTDLMWLKAKNSIEDKLYFGSSPDTLTEKASFTGDSNIYTPGALTPYQTYFWRIDTRTADSGSTFITGDVWSFSVEKPLVTTTQTIAITEDTHVERVKPTTNFNGDSALKIHTTAVGDVEKIAFVKFTIPAAVDSELSKVILRLHRNSTSSTKGVQVYLMSDTSWNADTLTWNDITDPNNLGTLISTVDVAGNTWQEIDVSAYIAKGVAEGDVAFAIGREPNINNRTLDSAESLFAPELVVEHQEIDPNAPPSTPTNLASKNVLKGISLNWSAVTGAAGYNVYRRISPEDFFVTPLNNTPSTNLTFIDDNPTLNTNYQYIVKAVGNNGIESYNSEIHITALLDEDLDGMADSWEVFYGLDINTNDADSDFDNDGFTNMDEYIADTDPSFDNKVLLTVSEDVFVRSDKADKNFEGANYLFAKTTSAGILERLSYLKFNVTEDISSTTQVILRVHRSQASLTSGLKVYLMPNSAWDASTMTWNTRPAQKGAFIATADVTANGWTEIDISGFITSSGEVAFALDRESSDTNRSIDAIESGFPAQLVIH